MISRSRLARLGWLPTLWYGVFLAGPLILILFTSFATRGTYGGVEWTLTVENYTRAFDSIYLVILGRSLWLALLTSVICFALALPIVLKLATLPRTIRAPLILLLAIPFLTNLVIRICAIKSFASYDGPLATVLSALSIPFDPFALSQNFPLVIFGMVSSYLPFMVFPLHVALERFDFSLVEAAQDLGANSIQVITRIIVPSLRKPIASGFLLVFVPALGEFVIPDLLGGAMVMLNGNLISQQFLKARDWPFGSSLTVILIVILTSAVYLLKFAGAPQKDEVQ